MHSSLDNDIELRVKRFCTEHFTFKIFKKNCASYISQKTHKHSFIGSRFVSISENLLTFMYA